MGGVGDWVNDPAMESNKITVRGGAYTNNSNTGGYGTTGDPRWFNQDKSMQQGIKRKRFNRKGWRSPIESFEDRYPYYLHFTFKKPMRINGVSFELLDYSQEWAIRYYDSYRNTMAPLLYYSNNNEKRSLGGTITSNTGSWQYYNYRLIKTRTTILEVRMMRNWVENSNDPIPSPSYSLGLKNLTISYISDGTEGTTTDSSLPGPPGFDERVTYTHYDAIKAIDKTEQSNETPGHLEDV